MRLLLIQNGTIKDPHIRALRDDYCTRFRRFGRLDVVESTPKRGRSLWPRERCLKVLLDERGKSYGSRQLADQLADWHMQHGLIALVIGEAYGHDEATRAEADHSWTLGPLTLPHQLAHLVCCEQLYRAATIQAGTGYHHD